MTDAQRPCGAVYMFIDTPISCQLEPEHHGWHYSYETRIAVSWPALERVHP